MVPDELVVEDALALAATIATKSPLALRLAKESVNAAYEMSLTDGLAHERRLFYLLFASEDQKEGMTAFLEKKDTGAFSRTLNAATGAGGIALTTGALVLGSHELLAALTASETSSRTRVISAPSIKGTRSPQLNSKVWCKGNTLSTPSPMRRNFSRL